jgi:hypothetical protein
LAGCFDQALGISNCQHFFHFIGQGGAPKYEGEELTRKISADTMLSTCVWRRNAGSANGSGSSRVLQNDYCLPFRWWRNDNENG